MRSSRGIPLVLRHACAEQPRLSTFELAAVAPLGETRLDLRWAVAMWINYCGDQYCTSPSRKENPVQDNVNGCTPQATMTGLYVPTSLLLPITIVRINRRDRCIAALWCCRAADHSSPPSAEMLPVFLAKVDLLIVTFVTSQGQVSFG